MNIPLNKIHNENTPLYILRLTSDACKNIKQKKLDLGKKYHFEEDMLLLKKKFKYTGFETILLIKTSE